MSIKTKTHSTEILNCDFALQAFKMLCEDVCSPFSERAVELLNRNDFLGLASMEIDPADYDNAYTFSKDYAVYSYLRKYEGFPVNSVALKEKCILDLEKIEAQNRTTNENIRFGRLSRDVDRVAFYAKRKIAQILGVFKYDKVLPHCEWGNGATASLTRRDASLDKKILEPFLSVTQRCLKYARAYLEHDIHWMSARLQTHVCGPCSPIESQFTIVEDGRFTTVPKNVKTLRPIEIQPTLNLFFQKGVGKFIRKRLQKNGINLDDQSRNQCLAAQAFDLGYSTIDLANASDTVSRELVRFLLPDDWYTYLNDLRTHSINVEGQTRRLERFSAMGNGFTFELESLIFYAIAYATREDLEAHEAVISVYGDDIITSRSIAQAVVFNLGALGFTVNKDKTFIDGDFYESCGKHYFKGIEVTPVYQKERIASSENYRDHPPLIRATNRFIRLANTLGEGLFLDSICQRAYHFLRTQIRVKKPIVGPLWIEGDGFVKDPYYRPKADRDGIFYIREFLNLSRKRRLRCDMPLLATSLRRDVVANSPFDGFVDVVGETRYLLSTRRCCLLLDQAPVWASSFVRD